ncbi:MAG: YheC/YheD family protein [Magnetococcales bacterium]|nr:YheC/YheD family protein [Magnetococcales bacterium]
MSLPLLFSQARPLLVSHFQNQTIGLPAPHPACTLFFSLCDRKNRAQVLHVSGNDFASVWKNGVALCMNLAKRQKFNPVWLRIDWITAIESIPWSGFHVRLAKTKRNYFRHGLALDPGLKIAFLEQELHANAMLYGGDEFEEGRLNSGNFTRYATARYGKNFTPDFTPTNTVHLLTTEGLFVAVDAALAALPGGATPQWLPHHRLDGGRRAIAPLNADQVLALIDSSSAFLGKQVKPDGQFIYGHFPCFGRQIATYNALRHASSIYSMLEGWELTRREPLLAAIQRALDYLTTRLIRLYPQPDGSALAFVVDTGEEIKLGANAVAILALVKYQELTGDDCHQSLLEQLALGIRFFQDPESGQFVHVLHAADLTLKDRFRIIYYDGEAAFGLMRLYGLTRDPRWLAIVEKAFEYFLKADHWKAHDHWLSYCSNELVRHQPDEKYFRFGVQNITGHLDFILYRETTYPTLLELSMAFEQMLERLEHAPERESVLRGLNLNKFYRAMHHRAHYLLNGFFWPELAMYFAKPSSVVGSFFIRHHTFRVRIDDIEHYLSGYVAYWKYLQRGQPRLVPEEEAPSVEQEPSAIRQENREQENREQENPEQENREQENREEIGLLRFPDNPVDFVEVLALAQECQLRGIATTYFSYRRLGAQPGETLGYRFQNGAWIKGKYPLPRLIDNSPPRDSQDRAKARALEPASTLILHDIEGKRKTLPFLKEDPRTSALVIPSEVLTLDALKQAFQSVDRVIIKPFTSNRGRNVFLIVQEERDRYTILENETLQSVDGMGLGLFLGDKCAGTYMLQRYIRSMNEEGKPFDIRVPVFRGQSGLWRIPKIYVRCGAGHVTSNLATGGASHDVEPFLSRMYDAAQCRALIAELEAAAMRVAEVLQERYDFVIDSLGCDFAVEQGRLYLFEVNGYPGIKGCLEPAVLAKVDYYQYLLERMRAANSPSA